MVDEKKQSQKKLVGIVVSDKMDKTVVVKVVRSYLHPLVKKIVKVSKKYKVHDPESLASKGDRVQIYEGRPQSKTKRMYLSQVLESASV